MNFLYYLKIIALVLFYWISYMVGMLIVFIVITNTLRATESSFFLCARLRFFKKIMTVFIIGLISVAGIPPIYGFWVKCACIIFITKSSTILYTMLLWIFLLFSLLFYFNILRCLFVEELNNKYISIKISQNQINILVVLTIICLFGFFFIFDLYLYCYLFFL